jgi:Transposase
MESTKYVGMDVHKETTSVAVMNALGKVVMESILETKAATIVQFFRGLRGNLLVTFEEGTWAAWLYDLLKPHVTQVTVCNPQKNALLKSGNKGDRIDARKLAELLRNGSLSSVYHGEKGLRTLKELSLSKDLTRVMNRLKALYHSWGIACSGTQVYASRHRTEWLSQIREAGVRCRAEFTYRQLDGLQGLRQGVRRDLLAESRKQGATQLLRQIPGIGPGGAFGGHSSDPAPVSHQAPTVGLQRPGDREARQWGISLRGRSAATLPQSGGASGSK